MSLFSRNSSIQRGVPVDFMGQPQQTNGEEKHPSGAQLSSQNLISAQPEGGRAALTLCGRDHGSDERSSELPALPSHHTDSLLSLVALTRPPPLPRARPPPSLCRTAPKAPDPSLESSAKHLLPVSIPCAGHPVNWGSREQGGKEHGHGAQTEMGLRSSLACSSL